LAHRRAVAQQAAAVDVVQRERARHDLRAAEREASARIEREVTPREAA